MKVIDIETGDIIKEYKGNAEGVYYTTQKAWEEYIKWCELMDKRQTATYFQRFIKGVIDE